MANYTPPDHLPIHFTRLQWIKRAVDLPLRDILQRLSQLFSSLVHNIFAISCLYIETKINHRRLRLVILTGTLGDIIAAQAVLPDLVDRNEDVVWLLKQKYRGILEFNPNIKATLPVTSYTETIFLRKITPFFSWSNLEVDGNICHMFGLTIKNKNRAGVNLINYYNYGTLSDVFCWIGCNHAARTRASAFPDPYFNTQKLLESVFSSPGNQILAFHTVSDDPTRSWGNRNTHAFAQFILQNTNLNIIEFGLTPVLTPSNRIYCPQGTLSLGRQAALMEKASYFVGVDSGFSHLAKATNKGCILLIGKLGSFGNHVPLQLDQSDIVLRSSEEVSQVSVEEVIEAFLQAPYARYLCSKGLPHD